MNHPTVEYLNKIQWMNKPQSKHACLINLSKLMSFLNGLIRKIFHKTHGFNCLCDTGQCISPRWNLFARQMFLKSCRSIDNCFTSRINGEWAIYVKQHAGCGPRGDFQTDGKLPLPGMVAATMPTMWHVVIHSSEY